MIDYYRVRRATVRLGDLLRQGKLDDVGRLLLHRFRLARAARGSVRQTNRVPPIPIDAKSEVLDVAGVVVRKPSLVYPGSARRRASIVIPCYNYGAYLAEAIASARAQTLNDVEVIVVDDGSTDPTTVALVGALEAEPDLRIIRQANGGLVSARNAGIGVAEGEYICCLDADDRLLPGYLEATILAMEADRSIGFAYSWGRLFGDAEQIWQTRDFDIQGALEDNHTPAVAVFRRDDWRAAGGYRTEMREGYEDWEFWLRLADLGRRGRVVRAPLFEHRRHGRTMTHEAHGRRQALMARMRALNPGIARSRDRRAMIAAVTGRPAAFDGFALAIRSPPDLHKAHLLVVMPWLQSGGAEMVLLDVLQELAGTWRITIVTTLPDDQPLWREFAQITTDIFPMAGSFTGKAAFALLMHLARTRGTSVILSSGAEWLYGHAATIKASLPAVRLIDILHNALPAGHLAGAVAASASIDRHVVVAPHIRLALLDRHVSADRISVIANGVEASGARLDPARRAAARAALGLAPETFAIGWVGRLAEEKAPLDFLDLVRSLPANPNIAAFMCGEGPLQHEVQSRIAHLRSTRSVALLPRRPRATMPELYAAFDVLVLTSHLEGLPLVVLEALGAGCPVIATDVGDVALLVRDGVTGKLVAPSDVAAMRAAVTKLQGDPTAREATAALAHTSILASEFSLTSMTRDYATLLEKYGID